MTDRTSDQPKARTYTSRRLALRYYDWGNDHLPPLILIHGGRDHARSWDWAARALRDSYHVIAPDLAGHGESEWDAPGGYTLPDYVYDLAELVRLTGAESVPIVGHSLGGRIAIYYAGFFPEKVSKLVAIEGLGPTEEVMHERTAGPIGERMRKWIEAWQEVADKPRRPYPSVTDVASRLKARNPFFSDEQAAHLALHTVKPDGNGQFLVRDDPAIRISRPSEFTAEDRAQINAAITCPVLLMAGADSWLPNSAEDGREKQFANARTITFERAGHWLQHDRFDAFIEEVRTFLA